MGDATCSKFANTPPGVSSSTTRHRERVALVVEMVDDHRGSHGVEPAERGQRGDEVVLDELDAVDAVEPRGRHRQHQLGEVEPDGASLRPARQQQGQQATVAGAKVEYSLGVVGDEFVAWPLPPSARRGNSSARFR